MKHITPNTLGDAANAYAELDDYVDTCTAYASLPRDMLLRHANEIEADRFAVSRSYCGFFRPPPAAGLESLLTPNQRAMSQMSERSRGRLWVFCVGLLFGLFAAAGRSKRNLSHPPALFRLREIIDSTRNEVPGDEQDRADFERGCADALSDLQHIAQKLGLVDIFDEIPDEMEYVQRMQDVRESTARDLEDY